MMEWGAWSSSAGGCSHRQKHRGAVRQEFVEMVLSNDVMLASNLSVQFYMATFKLSLPCLRSVVILAVENPRRPNPLVNDLT